MIFFFFFVPEKKSFWRFRVKFWLSFALPPPPRHDDHLISIGCSAAMTVPTTLSAQTA